jgi:dihydroflavonol-4-reductase
MIQTIWTTGEAGKAMRVFLTGGSGFIGLSLTRQLRARGWEVVAVVRDPGSPAARRLTRLGAHCVKADITEISTLHGHMVGCDAVIHNAGDYELGIPPSRRWQMHDVNVRGTENVLELARALHIHRVVHVSSVVAYGDSGPTPRDESFVRTSGNLTWYQRTKSQAHRIAEEIRDRGLPVIIVCPGAVIGANDHSAWGYLLRLYLQGRMPPVAWAPDAMQSIVGVHDAAAGIVLAAEQGQPGQTYLLSAETLSMRKHLAHWAIHPGGMPPKMWLAPALASALTWPLEPIERLMGLPAILSRETIRASAAHAWFTSDKARTELGWYPASAFNIWDSTIRQEMALAALRPDNTGLIQRILPLPAQDLPDWAMGDLPPPATHAQAA